MSLPLVFIITNYGTDYLIDIQVEFSQYTCMKGIKGLLNFVYKIIREDLEWDSPFSVL